MFYLFQPLMEDGKQVVRRLGDKEWGDVKDIDPGLCGPRHQRDDECIGVFYNNYPILIMKRFEEDPLKEIKDVYKRYLGNPSCGSDCPAWNAIVKVVERLEGK